MSRVDVVTEFLLQQAESDKTEFFASFLSEMSLWKRWLQVVSFKKYIDRLTLEQLNTAVSDTAIRFLIDCQMTLEQYVQFLISQDLEIRAKSSLLEYITTLELNRLKTADDGLKALSVMVDPPLADRPYIESRIVKKEKEMAIAFLQTFLSEPSIEYTELEKRLFQVIARVRYNILTAVAIETYRDKETVSLANAVKKNSVKSIKTKLTNIQHPDLGPEELADALDGFLDEVLLNVTPSENAISRLINIKDTVIRICEATNDLFYGNEGCKYLSFMSVSGKLTALSNFLTQLLSKIKAKHQLRLSQLDEDSGSSDRKDLFVDIIRFAGEIQGTISYDEGQVPPQPTETDWGVFQAAVRHKQYEIAFKPWLEENKHAIESDSSLKKDEVLYTRSGMLNYLRAHVNHDEDAAQKILNTLIQISNENESNTRPNFEMLFEFINQHKKKLNEEGVIDRLFSEYVDTREVLRENILATLNNYLFGGSRFAFWKRMFHTHNGRVLAVIGEIKRAQTISEMKSIVEYQKLLVENPDEAKKVPLSRATSDQWRRGVCAGLFGARSKNYLEKSRTLRKEDAGCRALVEAFDAANGVLGVMNHRCVHG